jgi:hypothetical protein
MDRLLTESQMVKAISDKRHILELVGHKPNPQDSREAIAREQLQKDNEWIRSHREQIAAVFIIARQEGLLRRFSDGESDADQIIDLLVGEK